MELLVKSADSASVHLPAKVLNAARMDAEQRVAVRVEGRAVIINPVADEDPLDRLLSQITPANLHGEVSFGRPVGNEAL